MESSGWAVFKTVPGFAFRATFEVDIEGFTPVKVVVATTASTYIYWPIVCMTQFISQISISMFVSWSIQIVGLISVSIDEIFCTACCHLLDHVDEDDNDNDDGDDTGDHNGDDHGGGGW